MFHLHLQYLFSFSYLHNNVQGSELCRTYSVGIPAFLHNKPRRFVEHCLKRIPPHVNCIPPGNITCMGEKRYSVLSVDSGNKYAVTITDEQPTCSCVDYSRNHLPCKHMLAVFSEVPGCSWNDLPEGYRNSPCFNLDTDILLSTQKAQVMKQTNKICLAHKALMMYIYQRNLNLLLHFIKKQWLTQKVPPGQFTSF